MPRWLKITLKISIGAVLLVLLLWLGVAGYVSANKKSVLKSITEQLNEGLNGTLAIESMEPTLVRGFPGVSIELKNVLLRDSLWKDHKHDLLSAKRVYVSVNAFSIVRGRPRIRDISIEGAKIYLFTDSSGYSNTRIFKPKEKKTKDEKDDGQPRIAKFYFKDVNLVFENNTKFKLFQVDIKTLAGTFDYKPGGWDATADVTTLIKDFAFNVKAGSFLKNKTLVADLSFSYDKATEVLTLPVQEITIDDDDLMMNAKFFLKEKPSQFEIRIKSDGIRYKNAIALVSPNISKNLKMMDLTEPIKLEANIKGRMKFRDTPLVRVNWEIKDNIFTIPGGKITDISFTGNFTNQADPTQGHNDRNSRIEVFGMKGKYADIPFNADTVQVTNIIQPTLEGRFRSKFPVTKLGPLLGDASFQFKTGEADLNLVYKATLNPKDNEAAFIKGYVQVKNAAMTYVPRGLGFTNSNLTLLFTGHDLYIKDVRLQSGSTVLNMNGSLLNFLNLYYTDPSKIILDWNIKSNLVNLNEFRSLISNRASTTRRPATTESSNAQITRLSRQLDAVLEQSSVHMMLHVDKVIYRKFQATNINADVTMAQKGISLKNISVSHADGKILLNANMNQGGAVNHLDIDAKIENVHINEFLDAFENFGQTTISPQNIKGRFFANAKVSGNIKDNGDLVPRSMKGTLDFNLKDGALVNFEPLVNVGKYVFRKRKLENLTFSDIKNTLEIKGDKIKINPMMIESSALNVKLEGVYGLDKGTDIAIDIPLRNPDKDDLILDDSLKSEKQMKGLVIHLRAVDEGDGKVKIKLNNRNERELQAAERAAERAGDEPQAQPKEKKSRRLFGKKKVSE